MLNDLRYAIRTLRQRPGFALTAIASIGLAIGANSAIFSLGDAILFRPLPVPDGSDVVTVRSRTPSGSLGEMSYPDFADLRDRSRSFRALVAYQIAPCGFARDAKSQPQMRYGFQVSANFFRALGIDPQLGRAFLPEEGQAPGRDALVVLSHDFWENDFNGDRSVIGRSLRLNGIDFTVIGVAPASFTGMDQYFRPAFFIPATMGPTIYTYDLLTNRGDRGWVVKGLLKPTVSIAAANAELSGLAKSLESSFPATDQGFGTAVRTEIQPRLDKGPGNAVTLALLFPAVILVLIIACANTANLTLSRGRARAREIAVRLAIGAGRGRLVRHLMTESLVIALAGGALGLLIAEYGVELFSTVQSPGDIPISFSFQLDHRVLAFTILVSVACSIVFGLSPALESTKTDLMPALKVGALGAAHKRWFGRDALVVIQVAGSLLLLVTATQLLRGSAFLLSQNPGFRTHNLIMLSSDPRLMRYAPQQSREFYKTLIDRAHMLAGVKSAALTYWTPMGTGQPENEAMIPEGYQLPVGQKSLEVRADTVDENFFDTFGVPILRGRGFLNTDRPESRRVAVANEALARRYFGTDPIGKRFRLGDQKGPWVEIVGVAATGKYDSVFEPPTAFLYLPFSQHPQPNMTLIAETYGDAARLTGPLQDLVRNIDGNMPIYGVRTMGEVYEQRSVKLLGIMNSIVGSASLLGVALALIGLYAVVAYQVARKTREIGIRMAIGAGRPQVMRMVLKDAAMMGATGIVIGLALSVGADKALSSSALGVPLLDPVLLAIVPVALMLTTLLAAAIPARRAGRIDPMVALRED